MTVKNLPFKVCNPIVFHSYDGFFTVQGSSRTLAADNRVGEMDFERENATSHLCRLQ